MKSDERQKKESTPWITQTFDPKSEQRVRVPVFGETWCRAMPAEDALITLETRAETLGKVTADPLSFNEYCATRKPDTQSPCHPQWQSAH